MANLFRKQAANYASARPAYPAALFDYIASKSPGRRLAWDVGTGNGQAAVGLSSIFESVLASDVSPEQISRSPSQISNIRFILTPPSIPPSDLHRLIAPPASVDLITVAQALHWLDLPSFYAQARSVLVPGGVLAAWCYTRAEIGSVADEIYRRIYEDLKPYWAEERRMVEEGYARVEFPFEPVKGEEGTERAMPAAERDMTAADFVEYVRSWSAYQTARERGVDVLTDEIVEEFCRLWGEGGGGEIRTVRFPICLRIGRVPL